MPIPSRNVRDIPAPSGPDVPPTTITSATQPTKEPGLFANHNFLWLWLGQSVSVLGNVAFTTTMVVWVGALTVRQPWSPLAVSGMFVASGVPTVLVGPFAGVLVDRWDKRTAMLRIDAVRALLVAVLLIPALGILTPLLPRETGGLLVILGAIFAVQVVLALVEQFFGTGVSSLVADIVPANRQPQAMSLVQTVFALASVVGPTLAAPLYFLVGPALAVGVNAASFAISALTVCAISSPPVPVNVSTGGRDHYWREFSAGLRFFVTSRVLVGLLIGASVALLAGGAFQALDYFFVTTDLHTSASYYGALEAATGIGLIAGTVLLGLVAQRVGLTRLFSSGLLTLGVLAVAYSRLNSVWPAVACDVGIGACIGGIAVSASPLLMRVTPRELLGRATAVFQPALAIATLAGSAAGGYLAATVLHGVSLCVAGMSFDALRLIFGGAGVLLILVGLLGSFFLREPSLPTEGSASLVSQVNDLVQD
jgi:MFS family permease